jgi:isocitrate dehydrogenase kinase/phosphatase
MDYNKLIRYCDLKMQQKKIEEEIENLRKDLLTLYQQSADIEIKDYTLKIVYQDKKVYNDMLLFESLPDPELWKHISKVDNAKISALIKANIISEDMLEGTYSVTKTPYLYVKKQSAID